MRGVPWIARRTKVANDAAASISKFVQVELAKQDCASRFQAANDFRVRGGDVVSQHGAGGCGLYSGGFNQVFYCERNSMERTSPFSAGDLSFSFACVFQRSHIRHGNKCVQLGIEIGRASCRE